MKNMLMKRMKLAGAVLLTALLAVACGPKTDEKKIDIAYVNWSEGIAMTNLAKVIFEEQGYRVNLLNADLAPVFASLSQKKADVFLDAWLPVTMADYITQYGDKLETLGTVYDNARIGLVVPEYVTINSIEELNQVRARFKGEIVGIDAGAGIMKATDKAIPDYGLDYKLLTSSGPAMTASLKKAIDKKEWVVVTGWTPHWMFDRFDLKILADPKGIYGGAEKIQVLAWKGFSEKDPFAARLLSNMHLTDAQISSLMAALEEPGINETDAARKWLETNRDVVSNWLPQIE
jgi:glycine betaine/proline transport system substrate-binding protein